MHLTLPRFLRGALALAALAVVHPRVSAQPDASAKSDVSAEHWLNSYYRHPRPERFVPAMFELSREGWFDEPGRVPVAIGFVASLFQQNPEQVDGWLRHCRALPPAHQRLIISALWYSGHAKGPVYLAAYARTTGPDVRAGLERALAAPADLHGAPVLSNTSAQLQWGVFLATGEAAPIRAILAALGTEGRVGSELRWALARHAQQHDRVLAICRAELDRQPNEVQGALRAVIHQAEARRPGSS